MKKAITVLIGAIVCASLHLHAESVLVRDGAARAEIVAESGRKPAAVRFAREELQRWTERVTGAKLPIVETPSGKNLRIVPGTPESSPTIAGIVKKIPAEYARLAGNDGFIIYEEEGLLALIGSTPKGVLNAVYRLLENTTDIVWVRPRDAGEGFSTVYGVQKDLVWKDGIRTDVPLLKERYWTGDPENCLWQARNGNNIPVAWNMTKISDYPLFADIGVRWFMQLGLPEILPSGKYSGEHPEYYPLLNGKRNWGPDHHLCFMNPDVPKAAAEEIAKIYENIPGKVEIRGFSHGDHGSVCGCPLCREPISLPGGKVLKPGDTGYYGTQYLIFATRLAEELEKKGVHARVSPGGYLFTADAPLLPVKKDMFLMFCPYPKNTKVPIYECGDKQWVERAEGWAKANGIQGLYEYYLCDVTPQFYHAVAETAQKDILWYSERGLNTMYLDTTRSDALPDNAEYAFDMCAIEYYAIARLMWNPRQDLGALRKEFCRRAYREAAQPMEDFYALLGKCFRETACGFSWRDDPAATLNTFVISSNAHGKALALLDEALDKARHPASRELIGRLREHFVNLLPEKEVKKMDIGVPVPKTANAPSDPSLPESEWMGSAFLDIRRPVGNIKSKSIKDNDSNAQRTWVRLMHDGKYLYVGWITQEPARARKALPRDTYPETAARILTFAAERDTPESRRYTLVSDGSANQFDALGMDEHAWNCSWDAAAGSRGKFRTALLRIPLGELPVHDGKIYAMFRSDAFQRSWFGEKSDGALHPLILQNDISLNGEKKP